MAIQSFGPNVHIWNPYWLETFFNVNSGGCICLWRDRRNEIPVNYVGFWSFFFYPWLDPIMWRMFRDAEYDPIDRCGCPEFEMAAIHADRYEYVSLITRSSTTAEKRRVSCPHGGRGARPSSPLHRCPLWLYLFVWSNPKPQRTYVKRAVRKAHFKMNRAFKVIQGHPYWCRH